MTTEAKRERLYYLISEIDDKKIESIYALFEDQIGEKYEWWEYKESVAELDERARRYDAGVDKGVKWEELEASINELRKKRLISE